MGTPLGGRGSSWSQSQPQLPEPFMHFTLHRHLFRNRNNPGSRGQSPGPPSTFHRAALTLTQEQGGLATHKSHFLFYVAFQASEFCYSDWDGFQIGPLQHPAHAALGQLTAIFASAINGAHKGACCTDLESTRDGGTIYLLQGTVACIYSILLTDQWESCSVPFILLHWLRWESQEVHVASLSAKTILSISHPPSIQPSH